MNKLTLIKTILSIIFIFQTFGVLAQKDSTIVDEISGKSRTYRNKEIKIKFPGKYKRGKSKYFYGDVGAMSKGYFSTFIKSYRFHKNPPPSYYTVAGETPDDITKYMPLQHVTTSDGYLSTFYVYKAVSKKQILVEIENAFDSKELSRKVQEMKINGLTVLNWRTQRSKTRLEYFLLRGDKYIYLFISSPYGEKDYIEGILKNTMFLK